MAIHLKNILQYALFQINSSQFVSLVYLDSDVQRLGIVDMLLKAGFTPTEAKGYFDMESVPNSPAEQIRILRKKRKQLLDTLHSKQQTLDHVDFMIWEIAKKGD